MLFFMDVYIKNKLVSNQRIKTNWILSKENQIYDYIIIGSSRAETMVDLNIIREKNGLRGVNLGLDGSGLTENYLIFQDFIKKNIVKKVFIQVDMFNLLPCYHLSHPFHEYRYFPYLYDDDISDIVKANVPELKYYFWKYLPFVKYAEFNSVYNIADVYLDRIKIDSFDSLGTQMVDRADSGKLLDLRFDTQEKIAGIYNDSSNNKLNPSYQNQTYIAVQHLLMIIEKCEINNIEVVIYSPPTFYKITPNTKFTEKVIKVISVRKRIKYWNFERDSIKFDANLFYDYDHLNSKGTKIFTKTLSDSLKNVF